MQPVPGPPAANTAVSTLQAADEAAAFKTAGFKWRGGKWRSDCADPDSSGVIESAEDLNGDDLPDVVITESGTPCYGNTGQRFWLVSKLGSGGWRLMTTSPGIPEFLKTKGLDGWPDVLVGGPRFLLSGRTVEWQGVQAPSLGIRRQGLQTLIASGLGTRGGLVDSGNRDVGKGVDLLLFVACGPVLGRGHPHQDQDEQQGEPPADKTQQDPGKFHMSRFL